jgi:phage-related protein
MNKGKKVKRFSGKEWNFHIKFVFQECPYNQTPDNCKTEEHENIDDTPNVTSPVMSALACHNPSYVKFLV